MNEILQNLAATKNYVLHFHRDIYDKNNTIDINIAPIIAILDADWPNDNVGLILRTGGYMTLYGMPLC